MGISRDFWEAESLILQLVSLSRIMKEHTGIRKTSEKFLLDIIFCMMYLQYDDDRSSADLPYLNN